jgi:hypothetical protein
VSEVSEAAAVRLLLADYAAADPQGKLNVVGGGISVVGFNGQAGLTTPFSLVVSITVPPGLSTAECAVEMVLENAAGDLVTVPDPAGQAQPMRIGQAVAFEKPTFPGAFVPAGLMGARTQWVLNFNSGLPLATGQRYSWRVRIDHETHDDWAEHFIVPGPMPGPVLG